MPKAATVANIPSPRIIRLETPHHIVRTAELSDATQRWCKWLLDPATSRLLNAKPAEMTMENLRTYIARFDRSQSHLLGIFDKQTGLIVGIRSLYVDYVRKEFQDNILIGEPEERGKFARTESTDVIMPYFFEELGMESSRCSVLAYNSRMLEVIARKGWVLERTTMKPSAAGGPPIEVRHYRLTREVWRQKMRERQLQS
ncbi:MAG: GNAT family protein [Alphaproteobacteria bacterium]|nr:GNAT family protein [Alphaproteobacteria bacterium]